jgi:hypothetical protein
MKSASNKPKRGTAKAPFKTLSALRSSRRGFGFYLKEGGDKGRILKKDKVLTGPKRPIPEFFLLQQKHIRDHHQGHPAVCLLQSSAARRFFFLRWVVED